MTFFFWSFFIIFLNLHNHFLNVITFLSFRNLNILTLKDLSNKINKTEININVYNHLPDLRFLYKY